MPGVNWAAPIGGSWAAADGEVLDPPLVLGGSLGEPVAGARPRGADPAHVGEGAAGCAARSSWIESGRMTLMLTMRW